MSDDTIIQLEDIDNMDRRVLQNLCKGQGIKANMKTEEMREALKQHLSGGERNPIYYKRGWFVENKKKAIAGGSIVGLLLYILLNPVSSPIGAPMINSTLT
jgi:hypothetical protein